MQWTSEPQSADGAVAREFSVDASGRCVPGIVWTPQGVTGRVPLVLIGHGGSQYKAHQWVAELAMRFVARHGFAAAAIDGPIHGARRTDGRFGLEVQAEFRDMWARDTRIDAMVQDWTASLDALSGLPEIDAQTIAWCGISMGTAYGLPLAAADRRIRLALLGMWGTCFPHSERLAEDAPKVRCPVLFQMKWDDQFFTREGQLDLFDRLGSEQKWLKVYMGQHVPVAGEQLDDMEAFIAGKLRALP